MSPFTAHPALYAGGAPTNSTFMETIKLIQTTKKAVVNTCTRCFHARCSQYEPVYPIFGFSACACSKLERVERNSNETE